MPVLDGFETTRQIHDSQSIIKDNSIPVIVLQEDRERCIVAVMNDHISKLQPSAELIFDFTGMSKRLMDDKELIHMVIEAFLMDVPKQVDQLKSAIVVGDLEQVARLAHKIKGASANVGGMALSTLACRIEQATDMEVIHRDMTELEQRLAQLKIAIKEGPF